MLQPTVRRTWAPRGKTPIHKSWDRHDRLSAISAITVSPTRRRLGLYFDILDHNVKTDDFETFVEHLLRRMRHRVILIMDRLQVHRSAARRLRARFPKRLQIEWLPAYAPELNPDEQVWNRAKYTDLANFLPDHVTHLGRALAASIRKTRSQQTLLRSFFRHAQLPLWRNNVIIQCSIRSLGRCARWAVGKGLLRCFQRVSLAKTSSPLIFLDLRHIAMPLHGRTMDHVCENGVHADGCVTPTRRSRSGVFDPAGQLGAENLALRQQLIVLQLRSSDGTPEDDQLLS